ncbi:MAG: bifunctional methylenetetrahydrofolate dehydrogenase/methenyltetrahydrofolate cyclohydrolase FolD [Bacillaceae bacterium]|nr:bifunctional methylenetetrahydrofolate dehydrogenase/methenyltetrahydrofolate cyclohydrolase FolD [Bacillaceae bacterium]
MSAKTLSGKDAASRLQNEMRQQVDQLKAQGVIPGLAVIIVGNNPASKLYVRKKSEASRKLGIYSRVIELEEDTSQSRLLSVIESLNEDSSIDGILVQLPLPKHIDETEIIEHISPEKDVDGFHPLNIGRLFTGEDTFIPCTPLGILKLLQEEHIPIEGKHAVIVGRSNIVGKPAGQLLLNEHATVTYCHSRTNQLSYFTKQADILIAAAGQAKLITGEMVKEGAVVIDVGNSFDENGNLSGDVDFSQVKDKASYITPVPNGVGPMTITMLLHNTLKAAKKRAMIEGE